MDRAEETRRNNAQEFSNHVSPWVAPSDQFLGTFVYNTYHDRARGSVVEVPAVDEWYNTKVRTELDEAKREAAWKEQGERIFR